MNCCKPRWVSSVPAAQVSPSPLSSSSFISWSGLHLQWSTSSSFLAYPSFRGKPLKWLSDKSFRELTHRKRPCARPMRDRAGLGVHVRRCRLPVRQGRPPLPRLAARVRCSLLRSSLGSPLLCLQDLWSVLCNPGVLKCCRAVSRCARFLKWTSELAGERGVEPASFFKPVFQAPQARSTRSELLPQSFAVVRRSGAKRSSNVKSIRCKRYTRFSAFFPSFFMLSRKLNMRCVRITEWSKLWLVYQVCEWYAFKSVSSSVQ